MKAASFVIRVLLVLNMVSGGKAGPGWTDRLISELDQGRSAAQMKQQLTTDQDKGSCCTMAITCESKEWKLRIARKPVASQGEFEALADDATACCRSLMCADLKSEFRCLWLPFCEWTDLSGRSASSGFHSFAEGQAVPTPSNPMEGLCLWKKEDPAATPVESNSLSRTIVYVHRKLLEKEEELQRNSAALIAEEGKLKQEEAVEHLTKEAEGMVVSGHYAQAERVLQEALREDPDGMSPTEQAKRQRESQGLKDLGLASNLLTHLESAAHISKEATQQQEALSPSTKHHKSRTKQSAWVKGALQVVAVVCIVLTAYITVGFRRGWRGTAVDHMAVELDEAAGLVSGGGYRSLEELNPAAAL